MDWKIIKLMVVFCLVTSFLNGQTVSDVQPTNYSNGTASRYVASSSGISQDLNCSSALDAFTVNVFRIQDTANVANYFLGVYDGSGFIVYENSSVYPLIDLDEIAINPFLYNITGYWTYTSNCAVAGLSGLISLTLNTVLDLILGDIIGFENGISTGFTTYTDLTPDVALVSEDLEWNGSSWNDNVEPSVYTDDLDLIVSSGDAPINNSAQVNSITVNNSTSLTIAPGNYLIANGQVNNNGTITLQADNTGYAQLMTDNTAGTGNYIIELYLSDNTRWRHLSSPLGDVDFNDIDDLVLNGTSAPSNQQNVFYWDASENPSSSGNALGWTGTDFSTDRFDEQKAYSIYVEAFSGSNFAPVNNPAQFSGSELTVTDQNYNIYNFNDPNPTQTSGTIEQGWNLIPNPYSANLSVDALLNDYNGDGAQSDNGGSEFALAYKAVHVWDAKTGQYKAYLADGESIEPYNTGSSIDLASIPPFQAFWVKMSVSDAVSSLTLQREHRKPEEASNNFFKRPNRSRIRLNVFNIVDSAWDQALAVERQGSSVDFDGWDAFKLFGLPQLPSLYFPSTEGPLAINSFSQSTVTVLPLNFRGNFGTYSLHPDLGHFNGQGQVFIHDKYLHQVKAFSSQPYTFVHNSQMPEDRFEIIINNNTTIDIEKSITVEKPEMLIYGGNLHIIYEGGSSYVTNIYTLSGKQLMHHEGALQGPDTQIPIRDLKPGVYLAELRLNGSRIIQKFTITTK